MLRIVCPYCGPRPESEFQCAGDADRRRPAPEASNAVWADYLYFRANPKGLHRERWVHGAGCGQWLMVERDTASHEVLGATPLADLSIGGPA